MANPQIVKIEDGPKTEAAVDAAAKANLAAEKAIENATEIAANAERAAAAEAQRLADDTAAKLAQNKDDMEWLKEHTRNFAAHRETINKDVAELKAQVAETKTTTAELLSGFRSLMNQLIPLKSATEPNKSEQQTPPKQPPENGVAQRDQRARKRRLI